MQAKYANNIFLQMILNIHRTVFNSHHVIVIAGGAAGGLTSGVNVGEYGRQWEQRQQNPASETPDINTRGCRVGGKQV